MADRHSLLLDVRQIPEPTHLPNGAKARIQAASLAMRAARSSNWKRATWA